MQKISGLSRLIELYQEHVFIIMLVITIESKSQTT